MYKKIEKKYDSNFYDMMSLPENEVKIINVEKEWDDKFIISLKSKKIRQKCVKCWSYNTERIWEKYEIVKKIKHLFISNYITVDLILYKRRFKCNDCFKSNKSNKWDKNNFTEKIRLWNNFIEQFSFIKKYCSYTEVFKSFILKEWRYQIFKRII